MLPEPVLPDFPPAAPPPPDEPGAVPLELPPVALEPVPVLEPELSRCCAELPELPVPLEPVPPPCLLPPCGQPSTAATSAVPKSTFHRSRSLIGAPHVADLTKATAGAPGWQRRAGAARRRGQTDAAWDRRSIAPGLRVRPGERRASAQPRAAAQVGRSASSEVIAMAGFRVR